MPRPDSGGLLRGSLSRRDGRYALANNTTGSGNAAVGAAALESSTTGGNNTAIGITALANNTIGTSNIAIGVLAGDKLTRGSNNIDIGIIGLAAESNTIRMGTAAVQNAFYVGGIYGASVTCAPCLHRK